MLKENQLDKLGPTEHTLNCVDIIKRTFKDMALENKRALGLSYPPLEGLWIRIGLHKKDRLPNPRDMEFKLKPPKLDISNSPPDPNLYQARWKEIELILEGERMDSA